MANVLVVDDEFGVADLLDAILEDEGHRVLKAANGRQGLETLAKEPVDLVFPRLHDASNGWRRHAAKNDRRSGSQDRPSHFDEFIARGERG